MPKSGRLVVLCGRAMLPRGTVPGTTAMLRSDNGSSSEVDREGEGGWTANAGAAAAADAVERGGACDRCAESGRGNMGGLSRSSSSTSSSAIGDASLCDVVGAERDQPGILGNEGTS